LFNFFQKQQSKQKMCQMVDSKRQLKTISGESWLWDVDAGIINQYVQVFFMCDDFTCYGFHLSQRGEISWVERQVRVAGS